MQMGDGGYFHENTVDANAAFEIHHSIGIYLPKGVTEFSVTIDAFNANKCRILTGSRTFTLGSGDTTLTLTHTPRTDGMCNPLGEMDSGASDAHDSAVADLSPEVTDAPPDSSDSDVSDTELSDHGDCGADTTVVSCFAPSDADASEPFHEDAPNSDCNTYCGDMINYCPGTFADMKGCIASLH